MTKKILIYGAVCLLFACKETKKKNDVSILSGKIKNTTAKKIVVRKEGKERNVYVFEKEIVIHSDGTFKGELSDTTIADTLSFKDNYRYDLYFDNETRDFLSVFLEKGQDLGVFFDAEIYLKDDRNNQNIQFSGTAAPSNEYYHETRTNAYRDKFRKYIQEEKDSLLKNYFYSTLEKYKLTDAFRKAQVDDFESHFKWMKKQIEQQKAQKPKGEMSTGFTYENYEGGKTSLSDFKGKYVYIDVWASWCGPCVKEIPSLKKLEEKYHSKKIAFISISVDENKQKWKNAILEHKLKGIQLWSKNAWNNQNDAFMKSYAISSIPRFILLDPEGKIIDGNAPRPSNPKIQEILDSLLK